MIKKFMGKRKLLLWAGGIALLGVLVVLVVLYLGFCAGLWGKRYGLLHYLFQCSCPRSLENVRYQKLYSEHAEILFPACDSVGPIPSPSGQKIAVINYKDPDESYVWFLQTGERIPFTWLGTGLDWITDDLLFVRKGLSMNVVDLGAGVEYPLPKRTDVRLASGEIAPDVLSALREAGYVIHTPRMVAAISPEALVSPEQTFIILFSESSIHMKQFLRDQDVDYLDYVYRDGTDVLHRWGEAGKLISPDGRFFYKYGSYPEDGIYLVETGERIVDGIPNWIPVDWVHDGVIIRHLTGGKHLLWIYPDIASIKLFGIREPELKLRVPAEYASPE